MKVTLHKNFRFTDICWTGSFHYEVAAQSPSKNFRVGKSNFAVENSRVKFWIHEQKISKFRLPEIKSTDPLNTGLIPFSVFQKCASICSQFFSISGFNHGFQMRYYFILLLLLLWNYCWDRSVRILHKSIVCLSGLLRNCTVALFHWFVRQQATNFLLLLLDMALLPW